MSPAVIVIPAYRPDETLVRIAERMIAGPAQRHFECILVVDDGSGDKYRAIFEMLARLPRVQVLRHAVNLGKGAALKTAFHEILLRHPDARGALCMDADGQHAPEDADRLLDAFAASPKALCLGSRAFDGPVPLRSRFGNSLTRLVFGLFSGRRLTDTQTGLRAIPADFLPRLLQLKGPGYEFELEMLLLAIRMQVPIVEMPIPTRYLNNNSSSHFNPLRDSLRIYFVFFRYSFLSICTALLDNVVFATVFLASRNLLLSTALARLVAGSLNFTFAKRLVFRSRETTGREAWRFAALVVGMGAVSYALILQLTHGLGWRVLPSKILVETGLFFLSFSAQSVFVFRRERD